MWWLDFDRLFNEAFTIYNIRERIFVHYKNTKLRILCRKVTSDFIQHTKASINIELSRVPITITYQEALT